MNIERNSGARAGFTLVELMMVVAILGVLAAVAIPSYISYVYKSKTAEAVGFLGEIKSRQESYRADFGQYVNIPDYAPNDTPGASPQLWSAANVTAFRVLGAVPPGRQTYFSYRTVAGLPGTLPDGASLGGGGNRGYDGSDFWFISQALSDLDGDRTYFTFESYSHSNHLWTSNAGGWE